MKYILAPIVQTKPKSTKKRTFVKPQIHIYILESADRWMVGWADGLLVNCYLSNSSYTFIGMEMKLAALDPYDL